MRIAVLLMALAMMSCSAEAIDPEFHKPEAGDKIHEFIELMVIDEGELGTLWSIETVYISPGKYRVDVHLSDGVTLSDAAKQLFDEMIKLEKCGDK